MNTKTAEKLSDLSFGSIRWAIPCSYLEGVVYAPEGEFGTSPTYFATITVPMGTKALATEFVKTLSILISRASEDAWKTAIREVVYDETD